MHKLDIIVIPSKNCKTFVVQDGSAYDINFPNTNNIIEIKPPGQTCFIPFNVLPKWCSRTFSCIDFNLCCINEDITVLPDGVYELKYSVDPNLQTMIEGSHMRICQLTSEYIKVLGLFLSNKHNYNKREIIEIEKELLYIKTLLDSSVFAVEDLFDNTSGIELYNEASLRLKRFKNGNFSGCCK